MDQKIAFNEAYHTLNPLVEAYLDEYLDDETQYEFPSMDEVEDLALEMDRRIRVEHPELAVYLDMDDGGEASVAFFGCGCLLWLILVGAVFKKCGRRRFRRPCSPPCKKPPCRKPCDKPFTSPEKPVRAPFPRYHTQDNDVTD